MGKTVGFLGLAWVCVCVATVRCLGSDLNAYMSNLVWHIQAAEVVKKGDDVRWLGGRWMCADGAIPPRTVCYEYASLKQMTISSQLIAKLIGEPGYSFYMECTFSMDFGSKQLRSERVIDGQFSEGYLRYGNPLMADVFTLKKGPGTLPQWFILEHVKSGDVLLLSRMPEEGDAPGSGAIKPGQESKPNQGTNAPAQAPASPAKNR